MSKDRVISNIKCMCGGKLILRSSQFIPDLNHYIKTMACNKCRHTTTKDFYGIKALNEWKAKYFPEPMNRIETLFIRACKADFNKKRLRSVLRRFYLHGNETMQLVHILSRICIKYKLADLEAVQKKLLECPFRTLSGSHSVGFQEPPNISKLLLQAYIDIIRFTAGSTLIDNGFIPPLKYRRKS
ncbi:MAG: hypothetical protein QM489_00945 [Candidatus Izemoplasma sp.]